MEPLKSVFGCCDGLLAEEGGYIHRYDCLTYLCEQHKQNKKVQNDPVNHPAHYTFGGVEVIDVLEDWFGAKPLLWQAGKYLARAGRKQNELEDLKKARWYLDRQIRKMEAANVEKKT